jgi:hypothetical protein
MRPALAAPAVLTTLVLLLAGCGGDDSDDGGDAGSSVSGADLVAPFEADADQAYDAEGLDRDDVVAAETGVVVKDCFAVDAAGAQSIGDAIDGGEGAGEWTTGTDGELDGQAGEESLKCPLERDGEPADVELDLSTTELDRDGIASLLTERGYREVEASDTGLDASSVLVLVSEQTGAVLAIWIDEGFRVSLNGAGLDRDRSGEALETAVTAVADHLEQ